jgi:hypothetical protein
MGKDKIKDPKILPFPSPIRPPIEPPIEEPIEEPIEPDPIRMIITQYYPKYSPGVHPYTKAYIGARYDGILKTQEEWVLELTKGL